jgi:hypothetical protein
VHTSGPPPQEFGWEPLCSSKSYPSEGGMRLTGDLRNKFTELMLLDATSFDSDGPIRPRQSEAEQGDQRNYGELPYLEIQSLPSPLS